jgi:hypothetical protein
VSACVDRIQNGSTALIHAAEEGHEETMQLLIRGGANIHLVDTVCVFVTDALLRFVLALAGSVVRAPTQRAVYPTGTVSPALPNVSASHT